MGKLGGCTGSAAVGASTTCLTVLVRSETGAVTWETGPAWVPETWLLATWLVKAACPAVACPLPDPTAVTSPTPTVVAPVAPVAREPLLVALSRTRISFRTSWVFSPC